MTNTFSCPHCKTNYNTSGRSIGKRVCCKQCNKVFIAESDNGKQNTPPNLDSSKLATIPEAPSGSGADLSIEEVKSLWEETLEGLNATSDGMSLKGGVADVPSSSNTIFPRPVAMAGEKLKPNTEYEVLNKIGQGGMGAVYSARQVSLDRRIALKTLIPGNDSDASKEKFIAEALVTGELDHPNIVPVYELGYAEDGSCFYAMKEIKGSGWDKVIRDNDEAENLQILLDVCDAIAFSHDRGYLHRDLKPENVMLGDYGEVLVMDWGLAVSLSPKGKAEHVKNNMSRAGSPAYMAPEMANCEGHRLGIWSDIYLLGGILFEIATGLKPHAADNLFACIYAAGQNIIQETERKDILVEIALKAMSTHPNNRFNSVKKFSDAIREYLGHQESIKQCEAAAADFARAKKSKNYDIFAQTVFGYKQALELWGGNRTAKLGLVNAQLIYAREAFGREDFDLARSLLNDKIPQHLELKKEVEIAIAKQAAKNKKLKLLTYASAAAVVTIVVGSIVSVLWIMSEQKKTEVALLETKKAEKKASDALQKVVKEQEKTQIALAETKKAEKKASDALQEVIEEQEKTRKERDKATAEKEKAELAKAVAEDALANLKKAREAEILAKKEVEEAKEAEVLARKEVEKAKEAEIQAKSKAETLKEIAGKDKLELAKKAKEFENLAGKDKIVLEKEKAMVAYGHKVREIQEDINNRQLEKARNKLNLLDKKLRHWEWHQLLKKTTVKADQFLDNYNNIAFSHSGHHMALSLPKFNPLVEIFNNDTTKKIADIVLKPEFIKEFAVISCTSISFSPDDSYFVATGFARQATDRSKSTYFLIIHNLKTGKVFQTFKKQNKRNINAIILGFTSDYSKVLIEFNNSIMLINLNTGKESNLIFKTGSDLKFNSFQENNFVLTC